MGRPTFASGLRLAANGRVTAHDEGADMQCPVCHGSGVSPATAYFDHVVTCGGCKGVGWIDDDQDDHAGGSATDRTGSADPEPSAGPPLPSFLEPPTDFADSPGGALGAAAAFQRHYDRILGTVGDGDMDAVETSSQLPFAGPLLQLLAIDRRHLAEMPNALPGRARAETETRLVQIVADYRSLLETTPAGLLGLERADLDRKLANALRTLGQARESLHDPDGAESAYEEARSLYAGLAAHEERESVEASLRQLRLHRDRDVDATLDDLRARLAATTDGLARAELLIELGEVHASRHDDLEAEDLFRSAERELEPHRDKATGAGMAQALTASLPMLMAGETPSLLAEFESITRVTSLLQRLYAGLTQVLADVDADEAQRYVELRKQLQGSLADGNQFNLDFSRTMMNELFGDTGAQPFGDDEDAR